MRFGVKSLLLTAAAVALVFGTYVAGSVASACIFLTAIVALLFWLTIRLFWRPVQRRPWVLVFVVIGWVGLIRSLTVPLPAGPVPLWRHLYWSVEDGKDWFAFHPYTRVLMMGIAVTFAAGLIYGWIVQLTCDRFGKKACLRGPNLNSPK